MYNSNNQNSVTEQNKFLDKEEKMSNNKLKPNKYQPKGLEIIYEDRDIIVVDKINGLLSIGTEKDKQNSAHFLLNNYVKKGNPKSKERVFIVHRLDRDTSGILVFAKTEKAKSFLQENWSSFNKKYVTVVLGNLKEKEGVIESFLTENKMYKVYSTKNSAVGKFAKTGYKVLKKTEKYSLLEIELFTGRKNQIRVHLSDNNHPVVGDKVYGKPDKNIKRLCLHSCSLTIVHPYTKKEMTFELKTPQYFKNLLNVK
jgi:tRNA pseudouridine32 synthase/23S rRNA pseudouridine746 synthase/23S rRNA pseudouridine1911/1915/1917 synthase